MQFRHLFLHDSSAPCTPTRTNPPTHLLTATAQLLPPSPPRGTTFVRTAEANGARLYPWNSNGNPLEAGKGGARIPFWTFNGAQQASFANSAQRDSGCNLVATEFGFPSPASNLLTPLPYLYITV